MATTTTMSGAQVDAFPYEEGRKWELLEGELIEMPSATPRHQVIVSRIVKGLGNYFKDTGLALPDSEFALSNHDRIRPDICAFLGGRARTLDLDRTPIPSAPDIAIEVISPSERASDSFDKVRTYLRNGTSEVWQVYPKSQPVQIHRSKGMTVIESNEDIVSDLLPSFSLAVATLFE